MTWTSPTPAATGTEVTDGPLTGAERPILETYLASQRSTLLNICAGLTAEQLALRPVPSSALSLLGLIRHLAKVERVWLRKRVGEEDIPHLHGGPGDPTDFDLGDPAHAEQEVAAFVEECRLGDAAVAGVPLEHEFDWRGRPMSLRMVYVHLIGEYARHNGHADMLREAIDGVAGR